MHSPIFITDDGSHSILSTQFDVSYHSKHGAIQETQHVFIDAALNYKAPQQKTIAVLEIGFGTGLNAWMTLLEAERQGLQIDYHTYEAFPISFAQAQELNYCSALDIESRQALFLEMHSSDWNQKLNLNKQFSFTKWKKSFHEIEEENKFDVIYFDAFAPDVQPELWETPLLEKMFRALKAQGVLTTYCAKGVVKRNFKSLGFELESIPGPPGKREMTRVIKP